MQEESFKNDGITELKLIPEHWTPFVQPLDIGVDNLFQAELTKLWVANPKATVDRELLAHRVSRAWEVISAELIQNAFGKALASREDSSTDIERWFYNDTPEGTSN